ncbi:competence type IV pilus minor pilin ComGF [Alkalihalobacillus sp. AL-G]|uniref:competence type IV pilus minor pilin ComGF n=1 Tax=Alkalihalobacillus sp. AL-G TaxID=2926399 RepID=UPI0027299302|nr:competence type IV pilus minor pilin ComGF [Alkalihalobacillus sp. AL-G]WLD92048.1 prepilin-type N-terminal cleavage/methylation domain-containing protein [Alkalihalobacillus sp. AL-G]
MEKPGIEGYTLLEMMIALSVFLTIVSLTPTVFSVIYSTNDNALHDQEVFLFFEQTGKEIQGSLDAYIQSGILYLTQTDGSTVSYEKYGDRIIRKVDGNGFETMVQNINGFSPKTSTNTVEIIIQVQGLTYSHSSLLVQPISNESIVQ